MTAAAAAALDVRAARAHCLPAAANVQQVWLQAAHGSVDMGGGLTTGGDALRAASASLSGRHGHERGSGRLLAPRWQVA